MLWDLWQDTYIVPGMYKLTILLAAQVQHCAMTSEVRQDADDASVPGMVFLLSTLTDHANSVGAMLFFDFML